MVGAGRRAGLDISRGVGGKECARDLRGLEKREGLEIWEELEKGRARDLGGVRKKEELEIWGVSEEQHHHRY